VNRGSFEQLLKRRISRRLAVGAGGIFGVSLAGRPTRSYARQATPAGTAQASPVASPVVPVAVASARFSSYPFSLGIASGDPYPDGVVLWTRLAPSPLDPASIDPVPYEVAWEIASDDAFTDIVQQGVAIADPDLAHSVHVDVTGLEPARDYFYRFRVGGETSTVGRTRTAPAAGQPVDAVRFAMVSCSNYEHGYFIAYRDIAQQNVDVVVHLGDYIYEYAPNHYSAREPENLRLVTGGETTRLVEYRNRYAEYRTDPDLQAVHASAPFIVTWDDHEVENNYAGNAAENPGSVTLFRRRRADAYQAYYEHMPLRTESLPVGPDMRLYRRLQYGDLLDINVLDTRQYRTDQPISTGEYPRNPKSLLPGATMMGQDQERWLLDNLDASTSTWNVIAQQVMMADTYFPVDLGKVPDFSNDTWSGYPEARARLLQHLDDAQIANPVVLTGDIHSAWAADLRLDFSETGGDAIGSEYIVTSVTAGGPKPATWGQGYKDNYDYIKYYDGRRGGYTSIEVTDDLWRADYFVVDDMEDNASGVSHTATFVTEAGAPGVKEA
jgi:alkaline phosphatase D